MSSSPWSRSLGSVAAIAFGAQLVVRDAHAIDANSSDGSSDSSYSFDGSLEASEISIVVSTVLSVVAVVVVVVLIVKKNKKKGKGKGKGNRGKGGRGAHLAPDAAWSRAPDVGRDAGRTLVMGALLAEQAALGPTLQLLARSPGALDALEADAATGSGPMLEALSQGLQVEPAAVVDAVQSLTIGAAGPVDQAQVDRLVVQVVERSVDDLVLAPSTADALLQRLESELPHADAAPRSPLLHRLAATLDVEVAVVADAAQVTLARHDAAARLAHPLVVWDEIADAVERAAPGPVLAREAQFEALAMRWMPSMPEPALGSP